MRDLVCEDQPQDYTLRWRVYGADGVRMVVPAGESPPGEGIHYGRMHRTDTRAGVGSRVRTCKQYLLHFGYPGRLSTAGNLAFPFTLPEVSLGPAYRFNVHHLLKVDDPDALFPMDIETVHG